MQLFVLQQRMPVEVATLEEWSEWFATFGGQRVVERTVIGAVVVYTAFQGLDNPPMGPRLAEEPFTFQTVVLGGPLSGKRQSYPTWGDAEYGHRGVVREVARSLGRGALRAAN
jgi:hypothetical protein